MFVTIVTIIRNDGSYPKNFQTDRGKEFYNASMQKLKKKHSINHYVFCYESLGRGTIQLYFKK